MVAVHSPSPPAPAPHAPHVAWHTSANVLAPTGGVHCTPDAKRPSEYMLICIAQISATVVAYEANDVRTPWHVSS